MVMRLLAAAVASKCTQRSQKITSRHKLSQGALVGALTEVQFLPPFLIRQGLKNIKAPFTKLKNIKAPFTSVLLELAEMELWPAFV
jgi:hypothetical protein